MYDKEKFPHYGKVSFPENLKPGETVWIREGMGEWEIGKEFGPKVKTAGPLSVVSVTDRPDDTTPLVCVQEPGSGFESNLCASLLSRERRKMYWLVCFTGSCDDLESGPLEIRGDSAFILHADSFRPGTIIRALKQYFKDDFKRKEREVEKLEVFLGSVTEIDKAGYDDYGREDGRNDVLAIGKQRSVEFSHKVEVRIGT